MTKYGVNSTPKWFCKTHNEAYNHDEGCKWCEVKPWVPMSVDHQPATQPVICAMLGSGYCACDQCQAYDAYSGMFP